MYAICGATGNIGRAITEKLLSENKKVRAIGRSADKLKPLADKGAEVFVADLGDTETMTKAFTGVKAVYAMIPPNYAAEDYKGYQKEIGESLTKAVKKSGVSFVVNLSSVGAHMPEGVGVVNGLHDQEQRLNGLSDVNVIHLRPSFFMENHFMQIDSIKEHGMMASPQNPEIQMAQIATPDIAEYAVDRLTKLDFKGKITRELLGSADTSLNEVAVAIGRAIGKDDLKFMQVSYDDARGHMTSMGISESVADGLVELYRACNEGTCVPTEKRSSENTTPTTINDFAKVFSSIYKG